MLRKVGSSPFLAILNLADTVIGISPERAADFSGGGFSNYFATPDYQADVVSSYIGGLGTEYAGLYNKSGRAYPDVAAQGVNFQVINAWTHGKYGLIALQVVIGGETSGVDGTSASSPVSSDE